MIRTPSGNVRSLYRPKFQALPRWLNVHFHWYELQGGEKPKRAVFISLAWMTRKIFYAGAYWGAVLSAGAGLLALTDILDPFWFTALAIVTGISMVLFTVQEVTSALVRGREFRFEGESADHGRPGDLRPTRVEVVRTSSH